MQVFKYISLFHLHWDFKHFFDQRFLFIVMTYHISFQKFNALNNVLFFVDNSLCWCAVLCLGEWMLHAKSSRVIQLNRWNCLFPWVELGCIRSVRNIKRLECRVNKLARCIHLHSAGILLRTQVVMLVKLWTTLPLQSLDQFVPMRFKVGISSMVVSFLHDRYTMMFRLL